ncbi:MAG: hypothetical protein ACE5GZ_09940 [Gammaproteobacteria bacterium]
MLVQVTAAVAEAAQSSGVARKKLDMEEYRRQLKALPPFKG